MTTIRFVEEDSNSRHTWVNREEIQPCGTTYVLPVGMILPSVDGYLATAMIEANTFKTKVEAKNFIIEQYQQTVEIDKRIGE